MGHCGEVCEARRGRKSQGPHTPLTLGSQPPLALIIKEGRSGTQGVPLEQVLVLGWQGRPQVGQQLYTGVSGHSSGGACRSPGGRRGGAVECEAGALLPGPPGNSSVLKRSFQATHAHLQEDTGTDLSG